MADPSAVTSIRYIDAATVDRLLAYPDLVEALERAFLAPPIAPPRTAIGFGERQENHFLLMPAVNPAGAIGVKLVTVHPALGDRDGGAVRAIYVLLDAASGEPRAIVDGGALTERRTAAASVLAARILAREDAQTLLVVGAGRMARALCRCYAEVLRPARTLLWARRPEAAAGVIADLADEGIAVQQVDDLCGATRAADIVSVATLSTTPLIRGVDVRPGTHVDLLGGFTPVMREADDDLIARALVVADGQGALETAGDLLQPAAAGRLDLETVVLLADLLADRSKGRRSAGDVTLFKSVGLALEDLAAAELLLSRL